MKPIVCDNGVKIKYPILDESECEYWLIPVHSVEEIHEKDRNHAWILPDGQLYVFDGKELVLINDHNNLEIDWGNMVGDIKNQEDLMDLHNSLKETIDGVEQNFNEAEEENIKKIIANGSELQKEDNTVSFEIPSRLSDLDNDLQFATAHEMQEIANRKVEDISVNGTVQSKVNGVVNITVPFNTSQLTNDSNFARVFTGTSETPPDEWQDGDIYLVYEDGEVS